MGFGFWEDDDGLWLLGRMTGVGAFWVGGCGCWEVHGSRGGNRLIGAKRVVGWLVEWNVVDALTCAVLFPVSDV